MSRVILLLCILALTKKTFELSAMESNPQMVNYRPEREAKWYQDDGQENDDQVARSGAKRKRQHDALKLSGDLAYFEENLRYEPLVMEDEKAPEECVICYEDLEYTQDPFCQELMQNNDPKVLSCRAEIKPHFFHRPCLTQWVQANKVPTCPTCRRTIDIRTVGSRKKASCFCLPDINTLVPAFVECGFWLGRVFCYATFFDEN